MNSRIMSASVLKKIALKMKRSSCRRNEHFHHLRSGARIGCFIDQGSFLTRAITVHADELADPGGIQCHWIH